MAYIEGFILAVPEKNKEAYRQHAAGAVPYFKECGATRMVETWADDVPDGKVTDFRRAVKAKPDEAVLFSWLEYPNREVRDAAVKKIMSDPKMKEMGASMPFDGQRMIWGGFKPHQRSKARARQARLRRRHGDSGACGQTKTRIARWRFAPPMYSWNTARRASSMPGPMTCPMARSPTSRAP